MNPTQHAEKISADARTINKWRANDSDCHTGATARALTGQPDFRAKGDNRWQLATRDSLCWPYAITHCDGTAVVSDSGNNRASTLPHGA